MAFNSYGFALLFLPAALAIYYFISLTRLHKLRLPTLVLLTVAFYAWGAARDLPILFASIIGNYVASQLIFVTKGRLKGLILTVGVCLNVFSLIYFKYTGFLVANFDAAFGSHVAVGKIALPLAISFYTFQQISFLVDTSKGIVERAKPLEYAGSILFFPSIISGPIVFFRELAPQLAQRPDRINVLPNILIGLVLFAIGLFKKTVVADSFGMWVDPAFSAVAAGQGIGVFASWGAATAYLLQIYYDFSGYSDMAIGVARMLGILLPLNFYSPLRCTSIADYWRRWHITLGRFCNLYIFQPLSIPLTRWSADRGLGRWPSLVVSTLLPSFLTMLIIGSWHGGNWTYVVFGVLHGVYMVANEIWVMLHRKKRKGKKTLGRWTLARGNIVTMVAVVFAIAAFRSPDLATAERFWVGMFGVHGLNGGWNAWPVFQPLGFGGLLLALVPGMLVAYLAPNAYQVVSAYAPTLEWSKWRGMSVPVVRLSWTPSATWAVITGVVLFVGLAFIARGGAKFVYFNF